MAEADTEPAKKEFVSRIPASEDELALIRRVRQAQRELKPGLVAVFSLEIAPDGIYLYGKQTHERVPLGVA